MSRVRRNFVVNQVATPGLTVTGTSVNFSSALGLPTITAPDYAVLVINPTPLGTLAVNSEIVYLTAYSGGTVGTIARAQEGTSASIWTAGTTIAQGLVVSDFTLVSGMANGDFPVPTASGQLFVSSASGASNPTWTKTVSGITVNSGTYNQGTMTGTAITSASWNNGTISGATVNGGTASGVTITGGTFTGGSVGPTTINSSSFNGGGILTSTIYSGNTFNAGSVPVTAIASGTKGTVLVTSGTGVAWGSAGLYFQDNSATDTPLPYTNYPTGAGTLTLTLSGCSLYNVTAVGVASNATAIDSVIYYRLKYSTDNGASWTQLGLPSMGNIVATAGYCTLAVNYIMVTTPTTAVLVTADSTSNRTSANANLKWTNQTLTALGVK